MNPDPEQLKRLLATALDGTIDPTNLSRLVQISRVIVQVHIRSRNAAIATMCQSHGLSEIDLAYDCIAEVFVRREREGYPKLRRLADCLGRPLADINAAEIFVAFRGLLVKIADAHIAYMYALADPTGGRIYRNIREAARKSNAIDIRKMSVGLVLLRSDHDPTNGVSLLPYEQLERACLPRIADIDDTNDYLIILSDILTDGGDRCRGVLVHDAVRVMKLINSNGRLGPASESIPDMHGLSREDIETIKAGVLYRVKEKIVVTYIAHGKLTRTEGEDLHRTIADIVDDWCEGAAGQKSLYDYLCVHRVVNNDEYVSRYRTKMEYLVKLAREEGEAWLLREL